MFVSVHACESTRTVKQQSRHPFSQTHIYPFAVQSLLFLFLANACTSPINNYLHEGNSFNKHTSRVASSVLMVPDSFTT